MEDSHTSTDADQTATPIVPISSGTAPEHHSPVDQVKDVAKKVRAMFTGRTGS